MTRPLLELDGVTKTYRSGGVLSRGGFTAVDDVHLTMPDGRGTILSIVGESGSGKTTTARMILGLVEPTAGTIRIAGTVTSGRRPRGAAARAFRRLVQPVSQNPFETFSARRRVDAYLRDTATRVAGAASAAEEQALVVDALRAVGLDAGHVRGKFARQFSGGELQRISIARALVCKPRLIVADEPVSMVDASQKMNIVNLFQQLKEERGLSVVYITHDLSTAYYLSDHVAIMFKGSIVEQGAPADLFSRPTHDYTRLLLDSIASVDEKWEMEEREPPELATRE